MRMRDDDEGDGADDADGDDDDLASVDRTSIGAGALVGAFAEMGIAQFWFL